MKVIKYTGIIILGLLFTGSLYAQQTRPMVYPRYYKPVTPEALQSGNEKQEQEKEPAEAKELSKSDKMDFALSVGTGFTAGSNNFSGNSTYIAPSMTYRASEKLQINFQGFIQRNSYNMEGAFPGYGGMNNTNVYGISGVGNYALTDRVNIQGKALYSEWPTPMVYNYGERYTSANYTNLSLGVNYKLSDKVQIGVAFGLNKGYNPYYFPNHMMNPMMVQDPFGMNNPFQEFPMQ